MGWKRLFSATEGRDEAVGERPAAYVFSLAKPSSGRTSINGSHGGAAFVLPCRRGHWKLVAPAFPVHPVVSLPQSANHQRHADEEWRHEDAERLSGEIGHETAATGSIHGTAEAARQRPQHESAREYE